MFGRWFGKRNRDKAQPKAQSKGQAEPSVQLPTLPWRRIGATLLAVSALCICAAVVVHTLDQPVKHVQVEGRFQRVSPVQIEQAVASVAERGFLSIELEAVRRAVAGVPWVDKVRVERSWPNSLRVRVVEHMPAARWGDAGLLNTRGELFLTDARHVPEELPRLDGPPGTESKVARLYLATYPRLLAVGLRLASVKLDARGAWELSLAHGVQVRLGRQDIEGRLERFIRVASPAVAPKLGEVSYIDMRYSNGFSVGWMAPAVKQSGVKPESSPNA